MMFKIKKLTFILGCALALSGCAFSFKNDSFADIDINPVMSVKHSSGSAKIMYLLGRYYQGKINYEKAIASYQKALATNPDYVAVHNSLGVIYAIQSRYALSLKHFNTAIDLAPMETYLHNNLGYALLIQGNEEAAAESLKKALQLDPGNKQARINLATVFDRVGLHDEAAVLTLTVNESNDQSSSGHDTALAPEKEPVVNKIIANDILPQKNSSEENLVQVAPNIYEFKQDRKDLLIDVLVEDTSVALKKEQTQVVTKGAQIEVSNGNGMTGMAKKVSDFLSISGFAHARLTNHNTFSHSKTVIFYLKGNQTQANQLNKVLPKPVEIIETDKLSGSIQVKLLLGQDFLQEVAYFNRNQDGKVLVRR